MRISDRASQIGNIAEAEVRLAALKRGYEVAVLLGNSTKYDQIFDVNGILLRIQVKKVSLRKGQKSPSMMACQVKRNRKATGPVSYTVQYKPTDFDFLIGSNGTDFWIVPMSEIKGRQALTLNQDFDLFKNAWHLIEEESDRRKTAAYVGGFALGIDPVKDDPSEFNVGG
jgi:hypothetical protein